MGENIADGFRIPQAVMNGWMNSSGHRANILSTNSWEIGVGYAAASGWTYYRYWTQDFGRRAGMYPLIINRDAASTDSHSVSWTIPNGVEIHTVTAELKTGCTAVTSSDAIYLPKRSDVTLHVIDTPPASTYLPLIER